MYEGDAPLAERRAQALSLDPALLAELLGTDGLRDLLDPSVVDEMERDLQHLSAGRLLRDLEGVADLLRTSGPLTLDEVVARCAVPVLRRGLARRAAAARRAIQVRVAGQPMWAAIEDAGRLRDALGVPLPLGVPEAFTEPVADPLGDLVARYARTHGPFVTGAVAGRYGLGVAVVALALRRLTAAGRVVEGEFLSAGQAEARPVEWCDSEVLRLLRRRCLARLRKEAEPVPPEVLGRFLPDWHGIGSRPGGSRRGGRGSARTPVRCSRWSSGWPERRCPRPRSRRSCCPGGCPGYSPALLDELTSAGEVVWSGAGALPGGDGWLVLAPADGAQLLLPEPGEVSITPVHSAVLEALGGGGALFFRMLSDRVGGLLAARRPTTARSRPRCGTWCGPDCSPTTRSPRCGRCSAARRRGGRPRRPARHRGRGRWPRSQVRLRAPGDANAYRPADSQRPLVTAAATGGGGQRRRGCGRTMRAHALALALLERHGVLTRGAVASERITGGFAAVYPVLRAMEEAGPVPPRVLRRGPGRGAVRLARGGGQDARVWPPAAPG